MKIVVIQLGAKGTVVRTMSILPALKKKYPNAKIDWITKDNVKDVFLNNPFVNKVLSLPYKYEDKYDLLYNFDIDKEACEVAVSIEAKEKKGFYFEGGYPQAFNLGAEYYLNTMFDDELKKKNKKTYQQMIFDVAELPFQGEYCPIYLSDKEKEYGDAFIKKNGLSNKKLIGIHIGSSPTWPSKSWNLEYINDFIRLSKKEKYDIIVFSGPNDKQRREKLENELKKEKLNIVFNNPMNSDREFVSLLNECTYIVSGDSFALHVAIALGKKTIGLFFCTSDSEIEDYGLLTKIVSPLRDKFFPERMNEYSEELTKSITAKEVMQAVENNKENK